MNSRPEDQLSRGINSTPVSDKSQEGYLEFQTFPSKLFYYVFEPDALPLIFFPCTSESIDNLFAYLEKWLASMPHIEPYERNAISLIKEKNCIIIFAKTKRSNGQNFISLIEKNLKLSKELKGSNASTKEASDALNAILKQKITFHFTSDSKQEVKFLSKGIPDKEMMAHIILVKCSLHQNTVPALQLFTMNIRNEGKKNRLYGRIEENQALVAGLTLEHALTILEIPLYVRSETDKQLNRERKKRKKEIAAAHVCEEAERKRERRGRIRQKNAAEQARLEKIRNRSWFETFIENIHYTCNDDKNVPLAIVQSNADEVENLYTNILKRMIAYPGENLLDYMGAIRDNNNIVFYIKKSSVRTLREWLKLLTRNPTLSHEEQEKVNLEVHDATKEEFAYAFDALITQAITFNIIANTDLPVAEFVINKFSMTQNVFVEWRTNQFQDRMINDNNIIMLMLKKKLLICTANDFPYLQSLQFFLHDQHWRVTINPNSLLPNDITLTDYLNAILAPYPVATSSISSEQAVTATSQSSYDGEKELSRKRKRPSSQKNNSTSVHKKSKKNPSPPSKILCFPWSCDRDIAIVTITNYSITNARMAIMRAPLIRSMDCVSSSIFNNKIILFLNKKPPQNYTLKSILLSDGFDKEKEIIPTEEIKNEMLCALTSIASKKFFPMFYVKGIINNEQQSISFTSDVLNTESIKKLVSRMRKHQIKKNKLTYLYSLMIFSNEKIGVLCKVNPSNPLPAGKTLIDCLNALNIQYSIVEPVLNNTPMMKDDSTALTINIINHAYLIKQKRLLITIDLNTINEMNILHIIKGYNLFTKQYPHYLDSFSLIIKDNVLNIGIDEGTLPPGITIYDCLKTMGVELQHNPETDETNNQMPDEGRDSSVQSNSFVGQDYSGIYSHASFFNPYGNNTFETIQPASEGKPPTPQ